MRVIVSLFCRVLSPQCTVCVGGRGADRKVGSTGSAACTDRKQVLAAAGELLKKCPDGERVEGVAELEGLEGFEGGFEGIRFVNVRE